MNRESVSHWIKYQQRVCCGALTGCHYAAIILLVLASFALALPGWAATLRTDKPDYFPGEHVVFGGSGWQPGETVHIDVYETSVDPFFWEGSVSAIVRPDGTFSNSDFL